VPHLQPAASVIGQGSASQGAFTGVFQNRIMPSANAIWIRGKHTFTFGGSYAYTQLNARDRRTNQGIISSADFSQFIQGFVTPTTTSPPPSSCRATLTAITALARRAPIVQDKFQFRSNLT
jgi:hypothetical protein